MARTPTRAVHSVISDTSTSYYTVPTGLKLDVVSMVISNITANAETITVSFGGLDLPKTFEVPANDMITIPLKDSPIRLNEGETIEAVASTASAINVHIAGVEVS
jgi:hypothetical protein